MGVRKYTSSRRLTCSLAKKFRLSGHEIDRDDADMRPQLESTNREVLAGLIERVTYHNPENGFCVLRAKARGHRDVVTVVGHAAARSRLAKQMGLGQQWPRHK